MILLFELVNSSVLRTAVAADRDCVRQSGEIEIELVLESFAEWLRCEFVEELAERRSEGELLCGEASAFGDPGIIAIDFHECFRPHEARNHHVPERLARERGRFESVKVKIA